MQAVLCDLAFSVDEYQARVRSVQSTLVERGLDVLLVSERAGLCYLTGMENCYMTAYYAGIIPAQGEPVLLASRFEMLNAEATSWCHERETFAVGDDPVQATVRVLCERGFARAAIGVQTHSLSAARYKSLQDSLPDAAWQDASDVLPALMMIKSAAEIEHLRAAGHISTLGMQAALGEVAAGKIDNEVAAAAYDAMVRSGGEYMCIEPIVTVGARSGIPHSTFHRTPIQPGDSVFIEVGGCYRRYSAPLMRTVTVAPVKPEIKEAANACRDSLNALLSALRPDVRAADAAKQARSAWEPLCHQLIWHGIYGYSVGLGFPTDWNDGPLIITEESDFTLQTGMCFHVTTSLRLALEFGVAMSETVVITDKGCEVLTGTKRELYEA